MQLNIRKCKELGVSKNNENRDDMLGAVLECVTQDQGMVVNTDGEKRAHFVEAGGKASICRKTDCK